MSRLPVVTPYAQTIPAVMNYLLSLAHPRFTVAMGWMQFVDSIIGDPERPERAIARFQSLKVPDDELYSYAYTRMDIDRYCDLSTPNLRYIPWGSGPVDNDALLLYIVENFHVLLMEADVQIDIATSADGTGAWNITVTPSPLHPIWFGVLHLAVVPAGDIRSIVWKLAHPTLDPTLPPQL